MRLSSKVVESKEFKKEHRSIHMFSSMDNLVTKFEENNGLVLAYGSDTNEQGITEVSFYKEVTILGVVLTLKVYFQASGDKIYYHSCSLLDDILGLDVFSPNEYAQFVWLKESLLEQVASYISYEVDYENYNTKDIEIVLKDSLLALTDFKVREDEPCKY